MATSKSEGPPLHPRSKATVLSKFAERVIAADGEWVQMRLDSEHKGNSYTHVLKCIGREYAEVTQANGVLYGRMKES